jgi:hypothetical protein
MYRIEAKEIVKGGLLSHHVSGAGLMHYSYNSRTCIERMRTRKVSLMHLQSSIPEGRQTSSHPNTTLTLSSLWPRKSALVSISESILAGTRAPEVKMH